MTREITDQFYTLKKDEMKSSKTQEKFIFLNSKQKILLSKILNVLASE